MTTSNNFRNYRPKISRDQIWPAVVSAVISAVITALLFGGYHDIYDFLTKTPPPAPVERAEMKAGIWGPSRMFYPCMPNRQCLAPSHVTIDSIANDPLIGDEGYFLTAKVLDSSQPWIAGSPERPQNRVNVKLGDTVLVRAFAQNDVAVNITRHKSPSARGARFNLSIPTNGSSELPITGHIFAQNAVPRRIYDTVFLHSNKRFSIEYKWGSAALLTRMHELPLSDSVVGEGALIGSGVPNGILKPGLSNYATVYMMLRIVPPTT